MKIHTDNSLRSGLLFIFITSMMLFLGLLSISYGIEVEENTEKVEGTIIDVEQKEIEYEERNIGHTQPKDKVTFEYEYNGNVYENDDYSPSTDHATHGQYTEGDEVEVIVEKDNPENGYIVYPFTGRGGLTMVVMSVIFAGVGLVSMNKK